MIDCVVVPKECVIVMGVYVSMHMSMHAGAWVSGCVCVWMRGYVCGMRIYVCANVGLSFLA